LISKHQSKHKAPICLVAVRLRTLLAFVNQIPVRRSNWQVGAPHSDCEVAEALCVFPAWHHSIRPSVCLPEDSTTSESVKVAADEALLSCNVQQSAGDHVQGCM
jgi:hypothetical protein